MNISQIWFIFVSKFMSDRQNTCYSSSLFITARLDNIFELMQLKQGCEENMSGAFCLVKDIFNVFSVEQHSQRYNSLYIMAVSHRLIFTSV